MLRLVQAGICVLGMPVDAPEAAGETLISRAASAAVWPRPQSAYDSLASTGGQLGRGNEFDCWVPTVVPEVRA